MSGQCHSQGSGSSAGPHHPRSQHRHRGAPSIPSGVQTILERDQRHLRGLDQPRWVHTTRTGSRLATRNTTPGVQTCDWVSVTAGSVVCEPLALTTAAASVQLSSTRKPQADMTSSDEFQPAVMTSLESDALCMTSTGRACIQLRWTVRSSNPNSVSQR